MALNSTVLRQLHAGVLLTGLSISALASSLTINPVRITLDETHRSAALTLKNEGNEARVIQTELLGWTQKSGENIYTPSRDLLVNPPIVTLKPGRTQIIRIGLNRKVGKAQELAYRLYVSEVPPPPREGFNGLRIALRFGVPVFVSPKSKPVSSLDWKGTRSPDGTLQLTLLNNGTVHLRVNSIKVRDPNTGQQLAETQQPQPTLLAGQTRQIVLSLPANWQGRKLTVVSGSEDGTVETRVGLKELAN